MTTQKAPRPYTPAEYRATVLEQIHDVARYWEFQPVSDPSPLSRVQGFGFSFLNVLDGSSGECPGSNLVKLEEVAKNPHVLPLLEKYAMPRPLFLDKEAVWLHDAAVPDFKLGPCAHDMKDGKDFAKAVWEICTESGSDESQPLSQRMRLAAFRCVKLLNAFYAYPGVHESDEEYHRDNGDNWWARPYGEEEATLDSVTFPCGMLHEMFHPGNREE